MPAFARWKEVPVMAPRLAALQSLWSRLKEMEDTDRRLVDALRWAREGLAELRAAVDWRPGARPR